MSLTRAIRRFSYMHVEVVHRGASYNAVRTYHRHKWPLEQELYYRRLKAGPIEETPRSQKLNWNEDVELYAFANRISEDISRPSLRLVFTDRSYALSMKRLEEELLESDGYEDGNDSKHRAIGDDYEDGNDYMSKIGKVAAEQYIEEYLNGQLPNLPSEGIQALLAFLTSTEKLAHIGRHLGITELVLYDGYPVPDDSIARAFLALIGVIMEEQGADRARNFVRDFVTTQLIGEDIDDIYHITNAMTKLTDLLAEEGRGEPVPRVIDHFGQATLVSCHFVGIYCDEKLIGKAPGESLRIAEDMAARDALMTIYGIQDHRLPLDFTSADKQNSNQILRKHASSSV